MLAIDPSGREEARIIGRAVGATQERMHLAPRVRITENDERLPPVRGDKHVEAAMLHSFIRLRGALACAGAALLLSACALPWQNYQPGADASTITARLGPPRE